MKKTKSQHKHTFISTPCENHNNGLASISSQAILCSYNGSSFFKEVCGCSKVLSGCYLGFCCCIDFRFCNWKSEGKGRDRKEKGDWESHFESANFPGRSLVEEGVWEWSEGEARGDGRTEESTMKMALELTDSLEMEGERVFMFGPSLISVPVSF